MKVKCASWAGEEWNPLVCRPRFAYKAQGLAHGQGPAPFIMPVNLATVSLRSERPEDEAFLREVYASTREEELEAAAMPVEMRAAFLDLQFKAQQKGYRGMYPRAEFHIIQLGNRSVGRMVVNRAAGELRLVDIALLPHYRNQGIGTALIQKLSAEAAATGRPLRLSVVKGQRAFQLYQRLGFAKTGESGWHDQMEWRAGQSPPPAHPNDATRSKTAAPG